METNNKITVKDLLDSKKEIVKLSPDFLKEMEYYFGFLSENTREKFTKEYEPFIETFAKFIDLSKVKDYYIGGETKGDSGKEIDKDIATDMYDNIRLKIGFMFELHVKHFIRHMYFNETTNYPKGTFNESMLFGIILAFRKLNEILKSGKYDSWSPKEIKKVAEEKREDASYKEEGNE